MTKLIIIFGFIWVVGAIAGSYFYRANVIDPMYDQPASPISVTAIQDAIQSRLVRLSTK